MSFSLVEFSNAGSNLDTWHSFRSDCFLLSSGDDAYEYIASDCLDDYGGTPMVIKDAYKMDFVNQKLSTVSKSMMFYVGLKRNSTLPDKGTTYGVCSDCTRIPVPGTQHSYDCSSCGLSEIPIFPNTSRIIYLHNNTISTITKQPFQMLTDVAELRLDHNKITVIEKDSLTHLHALGVLNISVNKLSSMTLKNLTLPFNIQSLDLRSNRYEKYPAIISTYTQLRDLKIDIFSGFHFDDNFLSLSMLSNLTFNPRTAFTLLNNTFEGLRNSSLKEITFYFGGYARNPVEIGFLKPFRFIQSLKTFRINMGGVFDIMDILKYLHGLRDIKLDVMDISGNNWYSYRKHFLRKKDLENLLTMCVKEINIGYSYIYYFPFMDALGSNFSKCLQKLVVKANRIVWTVEEIIGLVSLPSIKYLDISIPTIMKSEVKQLRNKNLLFKPVSEHVNVRTYGLKTIEYADLSGVTLNDGILSSNSLIYYSIIFDMPNLKTLKSAYTSVEICNFDNYFKGNLSYLDMSGWNCYMVNPRFFQRHNKLKILNASSSQIGHFINRKRHLSLFKDLSNLEILDISFNRIKHFSDIFFEDQIHSLRYLNLSHNMLRRIPVAILALSKLITIDFSYNQFEYFDEHDRHIIESLKNTAFSFGGNGFECSCRYVDSMVWMSTSRNIQNLACKDGNITDILLKIRNFRLKCLSAFWLDLSVVSILFIIIVIVLVGIGYRNKALVIYLYIKARRMIKKANVQSDRRQYSYDAFVSYSHMDEDWVTGPLFQYLNNDLSLQICIHHKDFVPGEPIAEEILRCIDASRKSVFVITRNFLASEWSLFEMDIARRHVFQSDSDTILVILKDDIPVHEMPNLLKKIWWRIVCLKFPLKGRSLGN
ncbi:hypothetical protein FSP39_017615 [Pinctada imbricata]|uniref:TIR domain-containing protein n=1 Tax=Pinctada imbricata TaxID=66713 RepID=A0AA89BMN2_PINIB|nr:hypothetical protein FSP39_017615 [Pinctada imbricata]